MADRSRDKRKELDCQSVTAVEKFFFSVAWGSSSKGKETLKVAISSEKIRFFKMSARIINNKVPNNHFIFFCVKKKKKVVLTVRSVAKIALFILMMMKVIISLREMPCNQLVKVNIPPFYLEYSITMYPCHTTEIKNCSALMEWEQNCCGRFYHTNFFLFLFVLWHYFCCVLFSHFFYFLHYLLIVIIITVCFITTLFLCHPSSSCSMLFSWEQPHSIRTSEIHHRRKAIHFEKHNLI